MKPRFPAARSSGQMDITVRIGRSPVRFLALAVVMVCMSARLFAQTALPAAAVGAAYTFQVTTVPAAPAGTVYSAAGLPPGLSINVTNGMIGGTPTAAGTFELTISLLSSGVTTNLSATLLVNPPAGTSAITSAITASGTVGTALNYVTTATSVPGAPVTSYNISGLPPGLSANPTTGVVSGTPTSAGVFPVSISANNANGTGAVTVVTVSIGAAVGAPVISGSATAIVAVNAPFTYTIAASNSPTLFAAVGLPVGLSLNASTGVISGTPTAAGASIVGLTASNASGTSAIFNLTISVGAVPVITSAPTASVAVGGAFAFALAASNSPVSYTVSGLPAGITVNTTTGALGGTPTTVGVYAVTTSATNATGTGPAAILTITVGDLPAITSPATAAATVGASFAFSLTASNGATAFTVAGLPGGLTASPLGAITGVPSTSGTFNVTVSATNSFGTGPAATLVITIAAAPSGGGGGGGGGGSGGMAPSISRQPVAQTVLAGGTVTFSVTAVGAEPLTYQWRKDGRGITGATASTLTLTNVTLADAGLYSVVVSNPSASLISDAVALTVQPVVVVFAPVITAQPADQAVAPGAAVTFTVVATSSEPASYQWRKDGAAIAGATSATLLIADVRAVAAGRYDVVVANSAGSVTSRAAILSLLTSRLLNVSVRSSAGTGDRTLIVGFRIEGTGTKQVLLRGVGPTLAQLNVLGALADPQLRLFDGDGRQTQQNDDWGGGESIAAAFTRAGAFALPRDSKDAAMLVSLPSGPGTAHVTSTSGTGVALIEAYDADASSGAARFVNVSARTEVGVGEGILIAGFVIEGSVPKTVLIRGVGPGLIPLGLPGSAILVDPRLRLFDGTGRMLQENNDWSGTAELLSAFARVGAFGLPGAASKDAALLVTLQPGGYTAQVSGVGETAGVALIEVYEVP